jgi:hypothetical protein
MNGDSLAEALDDQFRRSLAMLRDVTKVVPAAEWRRGDTDYQRPAGLAYHALETIDFYTSGLSAEEFPWGERYGADWEGSRSDLLPTQAQVVEYLDKMQARLTTWLSEHDLSDEELVYPWTGTTLAARALYLLRHTQHHVAELYLEHTRRGGSTPDWR